MKIKIEAESLTELYEIAHIICRLKTFDKPHTDIMPISDICLTIRIENHLKALGIQTVGDLLKWSEVDLLKTPNLGRKSLDEIKDVLRYRGMDLKCFAT